jgi:hypothetical protein
MGLQSILGFGQKPQSISKIKGMGKISKAWRQMVEKLDFSPLQVI